MTAHTSQLFAPNALVAEALAARVAIQFAHSMQFPALILESDNLVVVEAIEGRIIRRELQPIINDIQRFKSLFQHIDFTWVNRKAIMLLMKLQSCAVPIISMGLGRSFPLHLSEL